MEAPDITCLLEQWGEGDRTALDQLMPCVYRELKHMAAGYLQNERPGMTLQVTALVHEAYLRLVDLRTPHFESRKHFYVVAAQMMRRILVDHFRRRSAGKRDAALLPNFSPFAQPAVDVVSLDDALNRLAKSDPEKARIVELRYFAGLSVPEVAEVTGTSPATVKRHWTIARAWLFRALAEQAA